MDKFLGITPWAGNEEHDIEEKREGGETRFRDYLSKEISSVELDKGNVRKSRTNEENDTSHAYGKGEHRRNRKSPFRQKPGRHQKKWSNRD